MSPSPEPLQGSGITGRSGRPRPKRTGFPGVRASGYAFLEVPAPPHEAMKKPSPALPTSLAVLSLTLLSSCFYIRVRGDFSEADWMEEVIHDNHAAPASFRHDEPDFELDGFLWSHEGRLKMDFYCDPDELEVYSQSVRDCVRQKVEDEGYDLVSEREIGEHAWEYEYRRDGDHGRTTVEIVEREEQAAYPYRLELRWTED